MKKLILTSLILVMSFSANAQWWGSKRIKGNGNVTTETRKVGDFRTVNVAGFFDVELVKGKEGKITLEGEENILPYIITEVERGKLKIKVKKNTNISTRRKLKVIVPFEDIEAVSLGGSGNIVAKSVIKAETVSLAIGGSGNIYADVDADTVKSSIGGSGDMKLTGNTTNFKCAIGGSGSVKAYDLQTEELKASIAGSGSIKVSVSRKIKAAIAGSGSIYYKGDPKHIDTTSVGSGDVVKRG